MMRGPTGDKGERAERQENEEIGITHVHLFEAPKKGNGVVGIAAPPGAPAHSVLRETRPERGSPHGETVAGTPRCPPPCPGGGPAW